VSRRDKTKYPALDRNLNTKDRRYFIETEYINGVYGMDGKLAIRALNDEEKSFLNKYYQEVLTASFVKDGTDFYTEESQQRVLYTENNSRRRCLFNTAQRTGNLKYLRDSKEMDFIYNENSKEDESIIKRELESNVLLDRFEESVETFEEYHLRMTSNINYDTANLIEAVFERGDVKEAKKLCKTLGLERQAKKKTKA